MSMKSRRGTSLIEVLLASTLALMFSLAVLQVLIPVGQLDRREEETSRALELATSELEEVQRLARLGDSYQALDTLGDRFVTDDRLYVVRRTVESHGSVQKTVTVSVFSAAPEANEPVAQGRPLTSLWLVVTAP
ncbi:MAG: hypothetical protein AMXMBFR33_05980 [Candidatus Xenobia bacterium]|jgi:type II secretory pathway pseudopilin PulG